MDCLNLLVCGAQGGSDPELRGTVQAGRALVAFCFHTSPSELEHQCCLNVLCFQETCRRKQHP